MSVKYLSRNRIIPCMSFDFHLKLRNPLPVQIVTLRLLLHFHFGLFTLSIMKEQFQGYFKLKTLVLSNGELHETPRGNSYMSGSPPSVHHRKSVIFRFTWFGSVMCHILVLLFSN